MADGDVRMEDVGAKGTLFHELVFTIIPSDKLPQSEIEQLSQTIEDNGGEYLPIDPRTGRIPDLTATTHIIATNSDFPEYFDALDHYKHVVRPAWVRDSITKGKPTNPRQFSPDPALFMSEVVVFCSDLPTGDEEAIKGGVMAMGGNYSEKLSKFVTHIVALNFDSEACALAIKKNLKAKIVLPHWFDDCLRLGRKISETPYILAEPEILKARRGKGNLDLPVAKNNRDLNGASDPMPGGPPTSGATPTGETSRRLSVFQDKKVKISEELDLRPGILNTIAELLEKGGGRLTTDIDEATTYICQHRDGKDYITASQAGKDVGNLAWLYYLINYNRWTSPLRRLLHYPIPRNGIPGFESLRISLSNYTGEARIYLENLVRATGAEYTKTMKMDNTHLLTAHPNSEKCAAAREWGLHIVNHLWIEESYAQCRLLTITNPRFTHFPLRTNLSEVVGQAQFNRDALEKNYFPKPKPTKSAHNAPHDPVDRTPRSKARQTLDEGTPSTKANPRQLVTESSVLTPARTRVSENKENETPGTSNSRGAKARAISKLHELAPDVEQYQKELKRVGGVIHGRERRSATSADLEEKEDAPKAQSRKRSHEPEDDDDVTEEPKKGAKKKKSGKGGLAPIKHHMLVTKYEPWVENMKREDEDRTKLRELGITLTNEKDRNVTILCAPKIVRTKKFVSALASAPTVVSTEYLDYCLQEGELPDPEEFALEDRDAEKRFGIDLKESLQRAKLNKRKLLKDWPILCTEGVAGGWQTYADIVEANGGKCLQWKGRTAMTVSKRPGKSGEGQDNEEEKEEIYLISELKDSEVPLWTKFREMAAKHDMVPRIVSTEWLLFVAMAQYIVYDEKWALSEDKLKRRKK